MRKKNFNQIVTTQKKQFTNFEKCHVGINWMLWKNVYEEKDHVRESG